MRWLKANTVLLFVYPSKVFHKWCKIKPEEYIKAYDEANRHIIGEIRIHGHAYMKFKVAGEKGS